MKSGLCERTLPHDWEGILSLTTAHTFACTDISPKSILASVLLERSTQGPIGGNECVCICGETEHHTGVGHN